MNTYDIEDKLREHFHPPEYSMLPATASEAKLWNLPFEGHLWTIRQKYPAGWAILEVATTDALAAKHLGIKQAPRPKDDTPPPGLTNADEAFVRSQLLISRMFLAPDKDHHGRHLVKRWSDQQVVASGTLAEIADKMPQLRLAK